jgi:hypothetical protein
MRTSLAHSITERRRRHIGAPWRRTRDVEIPPQPSGGQNPEVASRVEQMSSRHDDPGDPSVRRVRAAGGPVDLASYSCSCGMVFSASVSTSVACPHCGTEQDW